MVGGDDTGNDEIPIEDYVNDPRVNRNRHHESYTDDEDFEDDVI